MNRHTAFICHDYMLVEVLDEIESRLGRSGIEVLRGPQTAPGKKLVYPEARYEELFARAEVMMFSSRSICSREVMLAAPRLRGIVNPTIGLETVDLAAANELGIIVGHGATPENFLGMAEATVMLILMLMYQPRATEDVLRGRRPRPRPRPEDAWARMLRGCTVGLLGLGRIARGVAERLSGFGVNLVACDPFVGQDKAPAGVRMTDLDALLRSSDIVAVLVSITPESRGMLGERELALMKPSAYLVNTSRGEAIDEAALYRALKEKRIAGAALDSFAVEPLPDDSPLRELDNVILTPHMVGHTRDVFASFPPAAVENITRILRGEPPLYCKNPEIIPAWRRRLAGFGV
ncbi:MAG TPA: 2-hydroxyacid dehydrogenase [Burkholderiales bacterium]|jgi:phosphoglycerate dehydrogenase-like enzyme|nr:2-hydroxyacid dehydrogenase [Burkholderiales bacterium]